MGAMDGSRLWFAVVTTVSARKEKDCLSYVMMRNRSLQSRSPAWADRTRPALIAASLIRAQPFASQAAGTVNQTSAECANLFTVLNGIGPASARAWLFERVLPFELEVLQTKTHYWAGDHMGYLDGLSALLTRCKAQARASARKRDTAGIAMWRERAARICLIIASQLIEMKAGSQYNSSV